jgi:paraquat-inducible protein B
MAFIYQSILLSITILLTACGSDDLSFHIQYDDVGGLKSGALLRHGQDTVGRVDDIKYTEAGNFDVTVTIDEPYIAAAKSNTLFMISTSDAGSKFINLIDVNTGAAQLIKEDQLIVGADSYSGTSQQWQNQINKVINTFSESVSKAWSDWERQTLDEQVAYIERELDKVIAQLKNLSESARQSIETEVMPQLRQQIELLKKRLEALESEDKLGPIEKKLETIDEMVEA